MVVEERVSETRLKNLDGIRAMAALMVILSHLPVTHTFSNQYIQSLWQLAKNGGYGVFIFFVLSGFLITRLILIDKNFTLKKFYLKRIYRIWPLFYLLVFINFLIVLPIFNQNNDYPDNSIWLHLFFLSNFNLYNLLVDGVTILPTLVISWSVSIEEQFYIFWPLIFLIATKNSMRLSIIILLMIVSLYVTSGLVNENGAQNFTTTCAIWYLGFGGILAFFHFRLRGQIVKIHKTLNIIIYLIIIIYLSDFFSLSIPYSIRTILNAVSFAYLIFEQCKNTNPIFNLDKIPYFKYIGKISYGIYMLHPFCFLIVDTTLVSAFGYGMLRNILVIILGLTLTYIASVLSYKYYEGRFLKLKEKIA